MIHYLVFDSIDEFNVTNDLFSKAFGYSKDGLTHRYSEPLKHSTDNRFVMVIQPKCLPLMTTKQLNSLVDRAALEKMGWMSNDDAPRSFWERNVFKIAAGAAAAIGVATGCAHYFLHWF